MEAIILAGGFGTRLQSVVKDVPKPMADINGKPFLAYLLGFLAKQGFSRVVLSVGYKKESIAEYFKDSYLGIDIIYADEDSPLGTGGAILNALGFCSSDSVAVLNGDTFLDFNAIDMAKSHTDGGSKITMALKPMSDFDRYGSVSVLKNIIISFEEKGYKKEGLINAGVYWIDSNIFDGFDGIFGAFSFEKDFLERYIKELKPNASIQNGYFIDIGIPEDYEKAQRELQAYL